jgi:hypothetical protein
LNPSVLSAVIVTGPLANDKSNVGTLEGSVWFIPPPVAVHSNVAPEFVTVLGDQELLFEVVVNVIVSCADSTIGNNIIKIEKSNFLIITKL